MRPEDVGARDARAANEADLLTPPERAFLLGAGALSVVAGPILFLFPRDTDSYFAWTIAHPLTPVFMGAWYCSGAGNLLALRTGRWSVARVQFAGIPVFTTTMLAATLLHLSVFNWDHPIAWAWLAVYAATAPASIALFARRELRRRSPEEPGPGSPEGPGTAPPGWVRPVFRILGAASLLAGLALFLAPGAMADLWPWALTPLTSRVVGGWVLSSSALAWMIAAQRRLERATIGLIAVVAVAALLLVGAGVHAGAFDGPAASVGVYLAYTAASGAVAAAALLRRELRNRRLA